VRRRGISEGIVNESFDPTRHRTTVGRKFVDLEIGETFRSPSRTVTEAHFAAFQLLSGDNHPIHYDIEYCRAHGHAGLLAHGFQVLAFSAAGAGSFPHAIGDSLIGFVEQSSKFLKPVYPGDTLYPALTISALVPQRTTGIVVMSATIHNQRGELVLSGEHKYLLRK
jgi:acyl dehydratase